MIASTPVYVLKSDNNVIMETNAPHAESAINYFSEIHPDWYQNGYKVCLKRK